MFQTVIVLCAFAVGLAAIPLSASSLRATTDSQGDHNSRADQDNLSRMEDPEMLARWIRLQLLEPVPESTKGYYLHAIPEQYRYLRPWTKLFLDRLSTQYRARFGAPLRITSLTRTESYQRSLRGRNGNAAAATGPKRSVHLTGASLDISKKGMNGSQQKWLRDVLISLQGKGVLSAIEEYKQPNFHLLVHRTYEDYVDDVLAKK